MIRFAGGVEYLVAAENHVLEDGLATLVAEALFNMGQTRPLTRIGLPNRFVECWSVPTFQARYGISLEAMIEKIATLCRSCGGKREGHQD